MTREFKKNIQGKVLPIAVMVLLIFSVISASLIVFTPNKIIVRAADTSDFDNYINITIDSNQVEGSLAHFPLLVYNSSCTVLNGLDENDMTFFDKDGNELFWELVYHSGNTFEAWVNLTENVDGGESIYLYYGDSDNNNGGTNQPTEVWDDDYVLVLHMTGANAAALDDSTSYYNNVTQEITEGTGDINYDQTGQVGNCVEFVAATDYSDDGALLSILDDDSLSFGNGVADTEITFEVWVNSDTNAVATHAILAKYYDLAPNEDLFEYQVSFTDSESRPCYLVDASGPASQTAYYPTISNDAWTYLVGSYTGVGGGDAYLGQYAHINGQNQTRTGENDNGAYTALENTAANFTIGGRSDSRNYFDGHVDEVFVSKTKRSDDWILTMYNMMYNKTSFYSSWDVIEDTSTGSFTIDGLDGNGNFTWSGQAGESIWANDSTDGTNSETLKIYTNVSGTSSNASNIYIDFSDFDGGEIFDDNLSVAMINASGDGAWGSISSALQIDMANGNLSINKSQWVTGLAAGWAHGTNPFPDNGILNYNSTIEVRVLLAIPADASTGTVGFSSACQVLWDVVTT